MAAWAAIVTPQQEHGGLGGDRHPDLVGDLEPAAALEALLGQQHRDVAE
jgi:hypothetical protein